MTTQVDQPLDPPGAPTNLLVPAPRRGGLGRGDEAGARVASLPRDLHKPNPRGITLIELLLVLTLLVMIGGMVIPVIHGSFASVRLRRAGDQVLTRWSQARARAIETGEVFQFQFTPDSGAFRVSAWTLEAAEGASPASPGAKASPGVAPPPPAANANADSPGEGAAALPEEIVFKNGQIAFDDPVTAERRVETMQAKGETMSTPILFFPDGTTSDASVVLNNNRRQFVRITLRGLTGVARRSDVLTQDELDRYK